MLKMKKCCYYTKCCKLTPVVLELNIRCKRLMISKFSLLSGKPKKALCGAFCVRSISEFNNSWDLDQRDFV